MSVPVNCTIRLICSEIGLGAVIVALSKRHNPASLTDFNSGKSLSQKRTSFFGLNQ
jgi:hypothetical protein